MTLSLIWVLTKMGVSLKKKKQPPSPSLWEKVMEVVEVSHLGWVGSENKSQKQKKISWGLREGKAEVMPRWGGAGGGERSGHDLKREGN